MGGGRYTLTVRFADTDGSAAPRTTLGNGRSHRTLDRCDDVVTSCAHEHGGWVVRHTHEDVRISFRSAQRCVECAVAVQRALETLVGDGHSVPAVRIGVSTGEETLLPNGQDGVDRGLHTLRGFEAPWHLDAVPWRSTPQREIDLLGDVRVAAHGRRIEHGSTPRALLLLAALALEGGRPVDRALLAFRLWPESTDRQARTNLRKVLHELRTCLADDDWIDVDQHRMRLRTDHVAVDVVQFRSAVARGDDRDAARSYRGPLLPGHWDDWVVDERRALEDLAASSLHRHLAATADAHEEVLTAKRLLALDRADEVAHRALIQAYAAMGNRSAALRAFHTCADTLERELGVTTSVETVALYQALQEPGSARAARGTAAGVPGVERRQTGPPLTGRDEDLAWLVGRWRAAPGRSAALVTGEAGIGKSRLVDELASRCEREGHRVLRSRAYESDRGRTLAPVVDWLRHESVTQIVDRLAPRHRDELGRLLPEHAPSATDPRARDPDEARALLFEAAAAALAAAGSPLLLVLDDLQWCGPDTVDFVVHLLRRGPVANVLVVATRREHERCADPALDAKLADLRPDGVAETRRLGRLQPVHTAAIARAATDIEWSDSEVARLHVETDGHPLFVIEAARAGPAGNHVTPTVQGVIQRRLAQLDDDHRALLDVAAVFGRRCSAEQLARALPASEDDVIDAVDEVWRLGLLVQVDSEFDFGHDLIRDVVIAEISPARAIRLHRNVAGALVACAGERVEAIADRLAEHYERAGMVDQAIDALAAAARRASTLGAHAEAVRHLERALHLLGDQPNGTERDTRELRLVTELGAAFAVGAGYGSREAQRAWDRAAALSRRLGTTLSGPVLRGLAMAAVADCRFEQAADFGQTLCRLDDPVARVEGHYVLGVTRFWQGDFARAEEHLWRARHDYDPTRSPEHRSRYGQDPKAVCDCRLAYLRALEGRAREADAHLEEAEALATSLDDALTTSYVWTWRLITDRHLGRPTTRSPPAEPMRGFFAHTSEEDRCWREAMGGSAAAERALQGFANRWRREGHRLLLTMWLARLADLRLRDGDARGALTRLDEADRFTEQRGQHYLAPELARMRSNALRLQGDPRCVDVATLALDHAETMGARGLALRARSELLRCTRDRAVAARLRSELEALRQTHHGQDLDDAATALAEVVSEITPP